MNISFTPSYPKQLFHYTSIQNLALILNTRRFRFGRLDGLDDAFEGRSNDISSIGSYYFVSCWTEDPEESIPFWHMYTPDMRGVRIGLPPFPFEYHLNDGTTVLHGDLKPEQMPIPFDPSSLEGESTNLATVPFLSDDFLLPIQYVPSENLRVPNFFIPAMYGVAYRPNAIGRVKSDHWRFQQEWRYILNLLPVDFILPQPKHYKNLSPYLVSILEETQIKTESVFMTLTKDALENMQITIGPRCTEAEAVIVKSLLDTYGVKNSFQFSALSNEIR